MTHLRRFAECIVDRDGRDIPPDSLFESEGTSPPLKFYRMRFGAGLSCTYHAGNVVFVDGLKKSSTRAVPRGELPRAVQVRFAIELGAPVSSRLLLPDLLGVS